MSSFSTAQFQALLRKRLGTKSARGQAQAGAVYLNERGLTNESLDRLAQALLAQQSAGISAHSEASSAPASASSHSGGSSSSQHTQGSGGVLRELYLYGNDFDTDGLAHLVRGLSAHTQVRILSLRENAGVSSLQPLVALGQAGALKELQELYVSCCTLVGTLPVALCEAMPGLRRLSMSGNLSPEAFTFSLEALRALPQDCVVSLLGTNVQVEREAEGVEGAQSDDDEEMGGDSQTELVELPTEAGESFGDSQNPRTVAEILEFVHMPQLTMEKPHARRRVVATPKSSAGSRKRAASAVSSARTSAADEEEEDGDEEDEDGEIEEEPAAKRQKKSKGGKDAETKGAVITKLERRPASAAGPAPTKRSATKAPSESSKRKTARLAALEQRVAALEPLEERVATLERANAELRRLLLNAVNALPEDLG